METSLNSPPRGAIRRRAPNASSIQRRAAKSVVHDVQDSLAAWHQRTATLQALLRANRDVHQVRQDAAELAALVMAARIELEAQLVHVEELVARHSLIRDVRRSLMLLRADLDKLAEGHFSQPLDVGRSAAN
jgi:hypothetical protein